MRPIEAVVNYLTLIPVAAAVTGLVVRRYAALCWAFLAYLLAVMTCVILVPLWPEYFLTFQFYSAKETGYFVLKALIAVEIWRRTFSTFPRARLRVGFLMAGVLLATAAIAASLPADGRHPFVILVTILAPRQQAGTLALFALVVSAAWWYRVPLHPVHRAILGGFSAYLPINTLVVSVCGWYLVTDTARVWTWGLNAAAYTLTTTWWAWAVWRPVRAPDPVIVRLQPWAHSW
jgi:hypothetical protein